MSAKRRSKVLCQKTVPYELYKGLMFTTIWLGVNPRKKMSVRLCLCRAFLYIFMYRKIIVLYAERVLKKLWKMVMRNIKDCIESLIPLLLTEYEFVLGRKGIAITLRLSFDKKDCFHLMGLQYLRDRPELSRDRGKVFDEIVNGKITVEHIESSDFYAKIAKRVYYLPLLESMIDSNDTIFKYNKKVNKYSMIEADYLMENEMDGQNLFLFLANDTGNNYFCRSFFPKDKIDYSKNQASWTLLHKKKIYLETGTEQILYDRL